MKITTPSLSMSPKHMEQYIAQSAADRAKHQAEMEAQLRQLAHTWGQPPWTPLGQNPKTFNPHKDNNPVETITTIDGFSVQCYEAPWKSGLRVYGIDNTPPLGAKVFLPFDWKQKNPLREYVAPETLARMKEYVESYENLVS